MNLDTINRKYDAYFRQARLERAAMIARHKRERQERTKRGAHKGPPAKPARNLNQDTRLAALRRDQAEYARMSPREQYDADQERRAERDRKTGALYADEEGS